MHNITEVLTIYGDFSYFRSVVDQNLHNYMVISATTYPIHNVSQHITKFTTAYRITAV